ncbi:MAG: hypothetical protein WEB33_03940 [Bacteroidota bacterium]
MRITIVAFMVFVTIPGIAQQQQPCSGPEYRQFDFWIGEWDVVNPKGDTVGASRIEPVEGGCGVLENYATMRGYSGKSINAYNSARQQWQQFWVDNQGDVLEFAGTLEGNELRYTGESKGQYGRVLHKLTFFHINRERVRQLWEQSSDEGKTWAVVFDGMYHRKKGFE